MGRITGINFHSSSVNLKGCPATDLPEFSFVGRSNVGKSSLINMLTGRKGIAKVSGTPGKTRTINHFLVTSEGTLNRSGGEIREGTSFKPVNWFLVDLPGYGYARLSKTEREKLDGMVRGYLKGRRSLLCTYLLIDSRHEPQQVDLDFINWMGEEGIPFVILFTKTDKLSKTRLLQNLDQYRKTLSESWDEMPLIIPTSAENMTGREEVLTQIDSVLAGNFNIF